MENEEHQWQEWHTACGQLKEHEKLALLQETAIIQSKRKSQHSIRPPAWWIRWGEYVAVAVVSVLMLLFFPVNFWTVSIVAISLLALRYRVYLNSNLLRAGILILTTFSAIVILLNIIQPQNSQGMFIVGLVALAGSLIATAAYILRPLITR